MTWDWQVFLTDDGSGRTYLEWMLEAWRWTLAVAGSSWVVAVVVGAVVGTSSLRRVVLLQAIRPDQNAMVGSDIASGIGGLFATNGLRGVMKPKLPNFGDLGGSDAWY